MTTVPGYKDIVPTSSIRHNEPRKRPKNFSREGVLEKALPVFWKYGFADISLLAAVSSASESGLNAIQNVDDDQKRLGNFLLIGVRCVKSAFGATIHRR